MRHNDRDYQCIEWWGDRSGYDIRWERCLICHPYHPEQEDELLHGDFLEPLDTLRWLC
jgi:hypothetical protein